MSKSVAFLTVASALVLYDALAAAASRFLLIEYSHFSGGSLVLFFLAGFFVCYRFGFWFGVLAGLIAGLAESTLGLAVSIFIKPTTVFDYTFATLGDIVFVVLFVSTLSTVIGLAGAVTAFFVRKVI